MVGDLSMEDRTSLSGSLGEQGTLTYTNSWILVYPDPSIIRMTLKS